MARLEYRGSMVNYHGPCEIVEAHEWPHLYRQGRYIIKVPNPFAYGSPFENDFELFSRVRPESIFIVED